MVKWKLRQSLEPWTRRDSGHNCRQMGKYIHQIQKIASFRR